MLKPGDLVYMSAAPRVFSEETPPSAGGIQKHGRQALGRQAVEGLLKPVVLSYLRSVEELFAGADAGAGVASRASDATQHSLGQLLEQVRCSEEFPTDECVHSALDQKLMAKTNQKHAQQQASIIGHLERRGLLDPKYAFVEFGAGKGELSVYVHAAISAKNADGAPESCFSENCFYLVDRKTFRQKFKIDQQGKCGDRKTRDGQGVRHRFERISIDIRDLDLASLDGLRIIDPQTGNAALRPIVAYSKHLCGGATDLTLKCLERYQQSGGSIAGIAIALCCHHACRYSMYVDHEYLSTAIPSFSAASGQWSGEQHDSFKSLVAMTSWAIDSPSSSSPDDASETGPEQQAHYSGLSYAQRRRAGHAVKRFLDIGRLWYVRRWLGMDDAELVYYTSHMASPENLALLATKMEV
ncbi:tRNA:m4X modification enzyme [Coemansia sp. RSA 2599]|nr:tRNA:m4X modification enzyme [Coemansia sp. RSA 2599]